VQPILTTLTKPHDKSIFTIVFIDHRVIVTLAAIHNSAKSAEAVNLAISCFVYVLWIDHCLPHPVPLKMLGVAAQMRVIGMPHAMQLPASTSPSASIARLMIAIVPH
jgi:hypothetical protein